jgi:hypothetical protein
MQNPTIKLIKTNSEHKTADSKREERGGMVRL